MVPIGRGLGLSMNIANAYLCIFYNMLIAYSLYFLIMSIRSELPWQKCNPIWSSSSKQLIVDFENVAILFNIYFYQIALMTSGLKFLHSTSAVIIQPCLSVRTRLA